MRQLLLAAFLLGPIAGSVAAQPRHHGAQHRATAFQAYAPGAFDRGSTAAVPASPQARGDYPCIWGALGRC